LRKHFNENVKKENQDDFDKIWKKSKTMNDMWHNYTRHVFNYGTFEDTTKNGSAINSIDKIKNTKVFIIKSMNDPIIGSECIDEERVL
jgi:predicted alpha/beta-fold hydrolase